ncbi:glycosyltransferase family 2 protein [Blastomonas sp.]|uniref:glycosyltransferase family 2 protein n=1 Tax=Blastomonas sp. TaxID=1909299 RepID=UPI003593359F
MPHEQASGQAFASIILHDAEDVVHASALDVFVAHLQHHDFVQLPVVPLLDPASRLVGGHYADEFAEAHGKALPVRNRLGLAIPCAGVGCAFRRDMLHHLALRSPENTPFATDSLTEDYELGLRIYEHGGRGHFVRMRDAAGDLVATRSYFPSDLSGAVRQKTRWTIGIALVGWDRMGWGKGAAEFWMRLRDRRAALAAVALLSGYAGLALWLLVALASEAGLVQPQPLSPAFRLLMLANGVILIWRLAMRALFTGRQYGVREAFWSVPRMFVGNIIAVMAARRAVAAYAASLRGAPLPWDKTRHHIPAAPPRAGAGVPGDG